MNIYAILMGISLLVTAGLLFYVLRLKPKTQMQQVFSVNLILLFILCFFVFLQIIFSDRLAIDPIYFDYFAYIGGCFIPVSIFFTSLIFANTKLEFKKWHSLFFIIPIISIISLWTNNAHHLFFEKYSIYMNEGIFGPLAYVHTFYSYTLLLVAIFLFLKYSIKNSGFFSKQSILILCGTIFPLFINALGTFRVIDMTIYITPIAFLGAMFFFSFAIFRFQFAKITPIALQKIVDRMSDGYLVINEENIIIDYNDTLIRMFNLSAEKLRNVSIENLLKHVSSQEEYNEFLNACNTSRQTNETISLDKYFSDVNKYFKIEINGIRNKNSFLGTLILFKDVTQHNIDMQIIKDNQDVLMEKERLASLGQLIGGIAHNLKTPIMSISGAAEGLIDLIKEYDGSIGDPEVTNADHHEIANDMFTWIEKIKIHTSYMSDVITAVKGQAVTLSENILDTFTVEELIKRINILMRHELKNALIELNIKINVNSNLELRGDVNSLVQVINNMISNAIQSYEGKTNNAIDLIVDKNDDDNLVIKIKDYGSGMKKEVQEKLFKEMITTKGKNGTGLGLFMSYSTIRAHFNGNITFSSEEGKGTVFCVSIPV